MPHESVKLFSTQEKFLLAETILEKIQKKKLSFKEKFAIISSYSSKNGFLDSCESLQSFTLSLQPTSAYVIHAIIAIGQGAILFGKPEHSDIQSDKFKLLISQLEEVEKFYGFMGGIIGYYHAVLSKIEAKNGSLSETLQNRQFHRPPGMHLDLPNETGKTLRHTAIRWGIESLPHFAHIYPVGGAGDRLNLRDEETQEPLPVAYLQMGGVSLLEGMIQDLQAMEYVYWKLHQQQIIIPIAMMTSREKNNASHIQSICEKQGFFGRPEDSFRQFIQPLVPVITEQGDFSLSDPFTLVLKPGGHGAIWKLAEEQGIFNWFQACHKTRLLIRQINNPVANTNGNLLAFTGIGHQQHKVFGFLSCERLLNAAEGMLVLSETKEKDCFEYCISNIEYTDFTQHGIQDLPKEPNGTYSAFPANTNILFANLSSIQEIIYQNPLPGLLINMKNIVPYRDEQGNIHEMHGGRLESMMQNIADSIVDQFPSQISTHQDRQLRCYIAYGKREQVISVTKSPYIKGKKSLETPEGCFYDQQKNCYDLFKHGCQMKLPEFITLEEFLKNGPPFIIRYHPALGPMYEVIAQKIRKGALSLQSYLSLQLAEVDIQDLELDGSLTVMAQEPLGHKSNETLIQYSHQNGKCELNHVRVVNLGINLRAKNSYWKNAIQHHEQMVIILHGNAEFLADHVTFEGPVHIEVPSGTRLEATMVDGQLHYQSYPIHSATWHWNYAFHTDNSIVLSKEN